MINAETHQVLRDVAKNVRESARDTLRQSRYETVAQIWHDAEGILVASAALDQSLSRLADYARSLNDKDDYALTVQGGRETYVAINRIKEACEKALGGQTS